MTFSIDKITNIFSRKSEVPALPVGNADYVVIDTELTGLDLKNDSIISIGAVKMKGGSIDLGNTFYELINPATEIRHESIIVHGITPDDVAEKPSIDKVICRLIDFCGSSMIIGHFIHLDMGFINKEMKQACGEVLHNQTVDTHRLYERIKMNEGDFSRHYNGKTSELDLFSIAKEYNIQFSEAHNALSDAFITAQLFQRFLSLLSGMGIKNTRDLLRVGRP